MHGFFFLVTGGQIKVVTDQGFTGSDVRGGSFFLSLKKILKAKFEKNLKAKFEKNKKLPEWRHHQKMC